MTITGANFIDGSWVPADSGKVFERRNPADDSDLIGTFPDSDVIDVQNAVDALDKAAPDWAATPPERARPSSSRRRAPRGQCGHTRRGADPRRGQNPSRSLDGGEPHADEPAFLRR